MLLVVGFGQVNGNEPFLLFSILVQLFLQFLDFHVKSLFGLLPWWVRDGNEELVRGLRILTVVHLHWRLLHRFVGLHWLLHCGLACPVAFLRSPI